MRSCQVYPNGIIIQIQMRRIGTISMHKDQALAAPFVLQLRYDGLWFTEEQFDG
jgi:hypothetical protein